MEGIDTSTNSYDYMMAFAQWRKAVIRFYTKVYRVFYPLVFLVVMIAIWNVMLHKNVLDQQHVRDRKKPQYTFHRIAMKTLQTRRLLCLRDVTVDCFRF